MLTKKYSKTKPTCKVTFTLAQDAIQGAKKIKVLGEFNNWNPTLGVPMKLSKGIHSAVIELPTGRDYQFRYLADNGIWENDHAADAYIEVPFDVCNSVVSLTENVVVSTKTNANSKSDTKVKTTGTAKPKAKTSKPTGTKTKTKKGSGKDNLKKIEGIGPKIAGLLNADGIITI